MCTPRAHQHSHQNKDSILVQMPLHHARKQTSALLEITSLRCHAFILTSKHSRQMQTCVSFPRLKPGTLLAYTSKAMVPV
jgi:hypothetical protein